MIFKQGKTDWMFVILALLFAGAVGVGVTLYINDTIWQENWLAQTPVLNKAAILAASPASNQSNQRGMANDAPVQTGLNKKTAVSEQDMFDSFLVNPSQVDQQLKEEAYKIYKEEDDCSLVDITTNGVVECLTSAGKAYDALLETRYSQKLAEIDKNIKETPEEAKNYNDEKAELGKAMASWKEYRQATCNAEYDHSASGTIRGIMYGSCYTSFTLERIFTL